MGLIEKRLLSSKIGREYILLLDREAGEALKRLKRSFGSSNPIISVRNEYAFHYPKTEDLEAAFQAAIASGDTEEWDWGVYFSRTLLNSFFFVSDYVFLHGIAGTVGEADFVAGYQKLLMSLGPTAYDLSEVAFGFTAAALKKHVGQEITMTVVAKMERAPNIEDLIFPFFVEIPGQNNAIAAAR